MPRVPRSVHRRFCALMVAAVLGSVGAHGQTGSDLRGVTLCLDPAAVQVVFEDMPPERVAQARPQLQAALTQRLTTALQQGQVRYEQRPSCTGQVGQTQARASVRYLDPRSYIGYGQDTYSYTVSLKVNAAGAEVSTGKRSFSAGWSELYAEAAGGRPFEAVMIGWGEEQARDLTALWRRDNPTLLARLTQPGPLRSGLLGGAAAVVVLALVVLFRGVRRR
ncbi:hypothetical protein [Deinococcus sp. QL22]|uniref:hypothetical protein n=1 Tax=Deinococcus sp. QL22 TaxID=2939437 RepID=UPI0020170795|nr:hypothetical protein [Deinococcus sp. QL22]UQN09546.1 hypothetical protein M1R55_25705 [Deinococcus sp. QL22]